ncbi:FixH family protein [Mangrovimonas aestuarii]|uniref:FixH family protein n=1 Tax=Mangrovimonas aestuarii TaxID=3018443 RepID=UPI0023787EDC|nr:FixH family protein [Mangrovimonas aestuarii]
MKMNWGTGIVLAFVAFIGFIMYLVVAMSTNKKYDHDLVTEEYYKEELAFQNQIDKERNSKQLKENISWKKTKQGLTITFPKELNPEFISGKVFLYRPSNKVLDFETTISLSKSSHLLLIPGENLLDGRWNITVDWQYKNIEYIYKASITY